MIFKKKGNNSEKKNNALKLLQGFVRQNQTAFNVLECLPSDKSPNFILHFKCL